MSYAMYKPQEWAARVLETLNDTAVYAALLNRDYEGDLRQAGDSVRIKTVGRPTISTYTPYSTTISPEQIMGADLVLKVDQFKYFAISVDDIDKRQMDIDILNKLTSEAAIALALDTDDAMSAVLAAGVATANVLTAATSVGTGATDDDAYELLVDFRTAANKANIPPDGRWIVVPPDYEGALLKDPRFVSFGTPDNKSTLKNGKIGQAAGFAVHVSNRVPVSGSTYTVIAGHSMAAGYVEQINKMEAYRPQSSFEDAIKGLLIYGSKVVHPDALLSCAVTFA